jgi:hypothetical protein
MEANKQAPGGRRWWTPWKQTLHGSLEPLLHILCRLHCCGSRFLSPTDQERTVYLRLSLSLSLPQPKPAQMQTARAARSRICSRCASIVL